MSDGVNMAILLGNLGADPELRFTGNGTPVLNMRLATTRSWKKEGEEKKQERTEWHNVVMFGPRAEGLAKILTKGMRIHVVGEITYGEYDDKDGNKRYRTDINARDVTLCDGPKGDANGPAPAEKPPARAPARKNATRPAAAKSYDASADVDPYA